MAKKKSWISKSKVLHNSIQVISQKIHVHVCVKILQIHSVFYKKAEYRWHFCFCIFVCFTCNITMFTFCLFHYDSKTLSLEVLINVSCLVTIFSPIISGVSLICPSQLCFVTYSRLTTPPPPPGSEISGFARVWEQHMFLVLLYKNVN